MGSINWSKVNNIVHQALTFLADPYPNQVKNYLDWYMSIEKDKIDIQNPHFRNWIVLGIPKMKLIVNLLNKEINKIDAMLQKIFTASIPLQQKTQKSKIYYEGIKDVSQIIVGFIGCRDDFNLWYLKLLRFYKNIPAVKSNIDYFEETCLLNRQKLLKII